MTTSYRHIILTRFNLQYEKDSTLHIQSAWLDNRITLFEQYCLPSIQQQTCKDFTWLLLADEHTPDVQRQRLMSYEKRYPFIQVLFCSYYEDFNILYQKIGEEYGKDYDWLLSTRLDNDDMLAADFVENLHHCIETHLPVDSILTYFRGTQYFVNENIVFQVGFAKNHFLSFLENSKHIKTCLGIDHTKVSKSYLRIIDGNDMWCEIVHSSNICNDYVPKYHYYWQQPQGQYPIALPITPWWKHIPFLVPRWFSFRLAQIKRLKHRILRCGRSV